MAEDEARALDPLSDRAQVRIFTLADYVAEEASGRLYISGGGLEWTEVVARPTPEGTHHLLSFSLIIRVAFPRAMARPTHMIEVFVFDRDGTQVGPDSLIKADMHFDLKHVPPDFTEVSANLPAEVRGFPVDVAPDDVIFFHLLVDNVLVSRLPVQLRPA